MTAESTEINMAETEVGGFNILKLLMRFLRNWYWFVLAIIVCLVFAYVKLRYTTPVYSANATVLLNANKNEESAAIEKALTGGGQSTTNTENEIEVMTSPVLIETVVNKLNLKVQYYVSGKFHDLEVFYEEVPFVVNVIEPTNSAFGVKYSVHLVDGNTIDISDKEGNKGSGWRTHFGEDIRLPIGVCNIRRNKSILWEKEAQFSFEYNDAITSAIKSRLQVFAPSKWTTKLQLGITDNLPERAALVLNGVIEEYIKTSSEEKQKSADSTIAFVNHRLDLVGDELLGIESQIEQFKTKNDIVNIQAQSTMLMDRSSEYDDEIRGLQVQLNIIEAMQQFVAGGNDRVIPVSLVVDNEYFSSLVKSYNDALLEKSKLLVNVTPDNPTIKIIDERIEDIKADMQKNMSSFRKSLNVKIDELRKLSGQFDSKIRHLSSAERTFLDYSRKQTIEEELYVFLLQKREELAITRSSTVADVQILSAPLASPFPLSPVPSKFYFVAFFIGLIIPAASITALELLNNKIMYKSDITDRTTIPILAEIGHNPEKMEMAVNANSRNAIAEQFRALRENLSFVLADQKKRVIMLTSSMSGEGKSFISVNLANIIALSGKKVLIIEFDLRRPRVHTYANVSNDIGFSNYIIGEKNLEEIIIPTSMAGVSVITSGPLPPNPAELILLPKTTEMFNQLDQMFDYIILDTPPIGLVIDAFSLSKFASATLFVTRQKHTPKTAISNINEFYNKFSRLNILINDVSDTKSYYGYGYGQTYGYGYTDEEKSKKSFWRKK